MSNGSTEKRRPASVSAKPVSGDSSPKSPSSPITRSASFAQLLPEQLQNFPTRSDSLRRSFSENVLASGAPSITRLSSTDEDLSSFSSLEEADSKPTSTHPVKNSDPVIAQFSLGDENVSSGSQDLSAVGHPKNVELQDITSSSPEQEVNSKRTAQRSSARRSVSDSISIFARRRSWIGTSRSPSPSPNQRQSRIHKEGTLGGESNLEDDQSWPFPQSEGGAVSISGQAQTHANRLGRKNSLLNRKNKRPLSSLIGRDSSVEAPSLPPMPRSFSTDKLPSLKSKRSNLSEAPAVPQSTSFEKLRNSGTDSPRKKDELWSVFRNLDGEYSKFQSRPSTTKTAVVRSSLLPFLKNYAEQPSVSGLKPEDLDRRSVILNKWWTGLLEMLNGRYGESVSGNDRPAVLEAATALMLRPEWTVPPPSTQVRSARGLRASLISRSTTSLGSAMSDFLVDSVFHNIKNTFTQNLLAQMAYVVQKMSVRNVAASVVTFCGKATAYAFFYCDGIAAILVRLWAIPTDTLRRVLAEYGIARTERLDATCDRVCTFYPACIHPLAFKSLQSMAKYLRSRPNLPFAATNIAWHGPWVSRWAGRDTDLFFVFVKHFTDLVSRSVPDDLSPVEQIVSPGWALVQAQILTVMRTTVQRSSNLQPVEQLTGSPATSFDDMLGEADATATMLPLPANGAIRSMAENRLIMLLRDCLANSTLMTDKARGIFAHAFNRLLKATARHTSIFDHNACFILCDLLEEAIVILMRYQQPEPSGFDWGFLFDVCKHMLLSRNSMTEVRLFAFLFSMWGLITKDDERRRAICLDWLLSRETFHAEFCHWCPMVRAFFMRLLIWKIGRPSTEGSDMDRIVMNALCDRLGEVWQNFVYIQQYAETHGHASLSTAPCSPAPGRQLLIMRDDMQAAPSSMFLSFDGILSPASNVKANPYERHSSQSSNTFRGSMGSVLDEDGRPSAGGKKRWALLKSLMPFSSSLNSSGRIALAKSGQTQDPSSTAPDKEYSSDRSYMTATNPSEKPLAPYQSLSFKFSLEWVDKGSFRKERRLVPPRLPPLAEGYTKARITDVNLSSLREPERSTLGHSKYAGRATAEWGLLITECRNFFERRLAEGVPSDHLVEVPSLSVEPFRKL